MGFDAYALYSSIFCRIYIRHISIVTELRLLYSGHYTMVVDFLILRPPCFESKLEKICDNM